MLYYSSVAGLPQRQSAFDSKEVHMGFVVDDLAMVQIEYSGFPYGFSFQ
jgi:hypothetical protein